MPNSKRSNTNYPIESSFSNLNQIVQKNSRFNIPIYQRLYVWEDSQIKTLLEDLKKGFDENIEQYYLGGVMLSQKENNIYDLIDGQQRLTTLWLIGAVIQNELERFNYIEENGQKKPRLSFSIRDYANDFFMNPDDFKNTPKYATEKLSELKPIEAAIKTIRRFFSDNNLDKGGSSDFRVEEFKGSYTIKALCDKLREDKFEPAGDTIEALNELLKQPDLYSKIKQQRPSVRLSGSLKKLEASYEKDGKDDSLKRLNRVVLEEFYPQETPKSHKGKFAEFLMKKVFLIVTEMPKDTDENKLFEVLNNRGVQLQHHEILKAKMLRHINDSKERSKYAQLWDACSIMDEYIEKNIKDIAGLKWNDLTSQPDDTEKQVDLQYDICSEKIASIQESNKIGLLDVLTSSEDSNVTGSDNKDKDKELEYDSGKVESIISFPMLLLHVLRIFQFVKDPNLLEFRVDEFKDASAITALCTALSKDLKLPNTQSNINTVEHLNEMLKVTDLYDKITQIKSPQSSIENIKSLKKNYDKTKSENDLKILNRNLLEVFYPQETPKSQDKIAPVDEKKLLNIFEERFLKQYLTQPDAEKNVKEYFNLLWNIRIKFDKHIIKWIIKDNNLKIHGIKRLYLNKDALQRKEPEKNDGFALLQSMLYHSQQINTHYWLTPLLNKLRNCDDPGEVGCQ